jgi:hypothetical protein
MVTVNYGGRLGNNLLQYISAYVFAKKFNLSLVTPPINNGLNFGDFFKLNNCNGDINNSHSVVITNNNFLDYLKQTNIPKAHYIFSDYFQLKDYILEYGDEIINCFKPIENKIDEVFVIYRIGDIVNLRQMLPIEYYRECLNDITFSSGYITSDTPNHPNVIKLCEEFGLKLYNNPCPMTTIDFARKFNKLILSEGTFSWWIGTLSQSDTIFYNERERFWHGDIFVNKLWKKKYYE